MVFAILVFEVHIPGSRSLKEKRRVVRKVIDSLHSRFRVSIIESDHHDLHQRAEIAVAAVHQGFSEMEEMIAAIRTRLDELDDAFVTLWNTQYLEDEGVSRRTERMEDLLRREISEIIRRRVHDPRVGMATISRVEITPDLRHAEVLVSVLGAEEERTATVDALQHARGFIRSALARQLRHLRVTPELEFELDRGAEHSQRITELLENLHDDDQSS